MIRVRLPILHVIIGKGKIKISLSAFAPQNLVSRDFVGSHIPRQAAHFHTQAESGPYLWDGIPPEFRGGVHLLIKNLHTPSGLGPEFIRSRNCVPMAFTAESPPAQGRSTSG